MNWVDRENFGISHFGLHPNELDRDNIRFDIFHLRCSITRRLMNYLRKIMLQQPIVLLKQFSDLLLTFWSDYNVLVWDRNHGFLLFLEVNYWHLSRTLRKL